MTNETVVIIPARGGSKGIPRKNLRIFNRQPLVQHAINIAKQSLYVTKIIVSSDDDEILEVALQNDVIAFRRDPNLANDLATLDPVIEDVVTKFDLQDAVVVTLQTTSPLVSTTSLNEVIDAVKNDSQLTSFTVTETRHLTWQKNNNQFMPDYQERLNRQQIPPSYLETGGVVACMGVKIQQYKTRFSPPYHPIEVSEAEAIDIDSADDWARAEAIIGRKRIAIFVIGNNDIGLGHLYRQLTLFDHLAKHEICFFCRQEDQLVREIITNKFINTEVYTPETVTSKLDEFQPDIIINDILDEWIHLKMPSLPDNVKFITFETEAHAINTKHYVINALYQKKYETDLIGPEWFMLRPEFDRVIPQTDNSSVKEILVTFGGVDPADQTSRLFNILQDSKFHNIKKTIVLGKGYSGALNDNSWRKDGNIQNVEIVKNTTCISKYMLRADIAITSSGRTVYELAKCQVPTISISQNTRELRHSFGKVKFQHLGLYSVVTDQEVENAISNYINNPIDREDAHNEHRKYSFAGIKNVLKLIEE